MLAVPRVVCSRKNRSSPCSFVSASETRVDVAVSNPAREGLRTILLAVPGRC
jgi:hypothetical protein